MDEPGRCRALLALQAQGFRAFKIGWGPFGRAAPRSTRRSSGRPRGGRRDALLMVDAGGSDAFWPKATNGRSAPPRCSRPTRSTGSRNRCRPDALDDFIALRRNAPLPIAGGEVLTRRQSFQPWLQARRVRHRPARCHQGRRHQRGAPHRLDGAGERHPLHSARLEHRPRSRRRSPARRRLPRHRSRRIPRPARPTSTKSSRAAGTSTPTACSRSPTPPVSASRSTLTPSRNMEECVCRQRLSVSP